MKVIGYILLSLIAMVFIRIGWVAFFPYEPITIHSINILDDDNTVMAGDDLMYETHYTKKMPLEATVAQRLVDSYVLTVPTHTQSVPLGEGRLLSRIPIPDFASPGTYRLSIVYTYKVSSFPERFVSVEASSGPFTIVNKNKVIQDALVEGAIKSKAGVKANKVIQDALIDSAIANRAGIRANKNLINALTVGKERKGINRQPGQER
jgi:hypothetical protein